jgi:hypothetical protein
MGMDDRKYWPRTGEELTEHPIPVSLINEPLLPDNVRTLVPRQATINPCSFGRGPELNAGFVDAPRERRDRAAARAA